MREHISYSELKIWNECPYKHKLKYLDRVNAFKGNEFTIFGTAIHDTCEKTLLTGSTRPENYFTLSFLKQVEELKLIGVPLDVTLLAQMEKQGRSLSTKVLPALGDHFGKYELISTEEQLYLPLTSHPQYFKGFIDLVIKCGDTYHVIDWKTCSWGWDARRKTDKILSYQLTLYKHFFSTKHGIDPKNIETHFALLKRTAKKNEVEFVRITSGDKKIKNALNLLNKALYNIRKNTTIKNRMSCSRCEFYKTKHCQ